MAGIGNQGHAGVADESNLRALFERDDQFRRPGHFIVFVVADKRFVNVVVRQKFLRMPRVFAGDLVGFFQDAQSAQRNVFEIADGRADKVKDACAGRCGSGDRARRGGLSVAVATGGNRRSVRPGFCARHGTSLARCRPRAPVSRAKRMVYFWF